MKRLGFFLVIVSELFANQGEPFGRDVLLIINFNHPHYENIDFLENLYKQAFPNIVFYGPYQGQGVHAFGHCNGWYSYQVVADAMKRYPDYRGYLFLQDDCVMNFWNLYSYNKDKVWRPACAFVDIENSQAQNWSWWYAVCGYPAIKKTYQALPENYKNQLVKNGGAYRVPYGMSDVMYIPQHKSREFIALSELCFENKVFLELAIPLICSCLDDDSNEVILNVFFSWRLGLNKEFGLYKANDDFVHPFKFSDQKCRNFIEKQFAIYGGPGQK